MSVGRKPLINIVVDVGHTKDPRLRGFLFLTVIHNTIKMLYPITNLADDNSYFRALLFFTKGPIMNHSAIAKFTSIRNNRIGIFKNFGHLAQEAESLHLLFFRSNFCLSDKMPEPDIVKNNVRTVKARRWNAH
jgi:hypothetical protein